MHKVFTLDQYRFEDSLQSLAKFLGSSISEDCGEQIITFDNRFGKGIIRGIDFEQGLGIMMINATFHMDFTLHFDLGRRHPVSFLYVHDGQIELRADNSADIEVLHRNESAIFSPKGETTYQFQFKANVTTQLITTSVIRFLYLRKIECDLDTIPPPLQEMFRDTVGEKSFYFKTSSESLTVSVLTDVFRSSQEGLERKLLIEAKSIELITGLIKRFRIEKNSTIDGGYKYNNYDIQSLNKAKNIIIDRIDNVPTIKELAQKVGLNENKLQKGFQLMFDKSIRQFIISYRMHLALHLLDQGRLSISEIAHKIGYTNKGHFSHLFKKEFGVLPSVYREKSISIPKPATQGFF